MERSKAALVHNILRSHARGPWPVGIARRNERNPGLWRLIGSSLESQSRGVQTEVKRFYREEFRPELTKRSAIERPKTAAADHTEWLVLHYHYIATGPKP